MAEVLSKSKLFSSSSSSSTHLFSISASSNNNSSSSSSLKFQPVINKSSLKSDFHGHKMGFQQFPKVPRRGNLLAMPVQMSLCIGKAQRWWEKGLQQNMKEINSAQDLVDSLLNSGNKLVIVDFFSPGCGGCKALHPKICQFAEMNPDVQFLQVNHEEHKSMCYSLNVHVLPFFRFYRGAHGRLCSFSCTNATIKKFRDALGKHSTERCSLGPPRGLEETELLALAANRDLSFNYTPKKSEEEEQQQIPESTPEENTKLPVPSISSNKATIVKEESEDKTLIAVGR